MRFRFQIHALTIPCPEGKLDAAAIEALVRRFIDTYEARFGKGSAFTAAGIELTTYRVVARCDVTRPQLRSPDGRARRDGTAAPGERQVYIQRPLAARAHPVAATAWRVGPASTASPSSRCRTRPS